MKNISLPHVFSRKTRDRQICRIMKLTGFSLFFSVFFAYAGNMHSQEKRVSLDLKNVQLEKVLSEIEHQTDYLFISNLNINLKQKVSISVRNKSVKEVLSELLKHTDITFSIEGVNIILSETIENRTRTQQTGNIITGKVVDSKGEPIIGANVLEKGTANGTITDMDGHFSLNVGKEAILEISYIGYRSIEITVGNKKDLAVTLNEDTEALDEVVVVGYGTQKKENLAGAVATLKGKEISSVATFDATNAISGRLPGAFVTQNSGEPGKDEAKILIRGRSTLGKKDDINPLIVVDGIPDRSLYEIDPNDIENISILKDASAAIYGSRAANGVILVTTKSGTNKKATLNYQFYQGFNKPTILPKTADAAEYAQYISDYQDYEGLSRLYSDRDIELYKSGEDPWEHPNTNWMTELVRDWTTESRHNLSISGGSDKIRYYASFGYKNNEAIYQTKSARYKQYNYRIKLDVPIINWIETSILYSGYVTIKKYPTTDTSQLFGWASLVVPTTPAYWPTGEPGPDFEAGVNPVVNTSFEAGYDQTDNYKNEATFKVSIKPPMIEGLSIDGFFNYDVNHQNNKKFKKPWTLYYPKYETAKRNANGFITSMELEARLRGLDSPELTEENARTKRKMYNVSLSYGRTFGDHALHLFGAYEQFDEDFFDFEAYRKYFISDLVQALDAGGEKDKSNKGKVSIYARKSWIGRLNYSFKSKYLLEFIFRRDGSLKFPPSKRWGNFPAILLAWRTSEEKFWKDHLSFINYFKLRTTYGTMGMDPGDPFQYINKYALDAGVTLGTNKDVVTKIYQSVLANPNITWEKQTTYNIGFDSRFLNQMFYLNTEFFYNRRSGILVKKNASVPSFTGLSLPDENIGIVDNKGIEIDAGFNKSFGQWNLDISGNLSWVRNKVKFMDEPERSVPWQQVTGHPYGSKLLYHAIGIFKTQEEVDVYPHWSGAKPGDVIFEDVNGDKVINADDRILMEKTDAPELFYGIKIGVQYKNWSLNLLGQGQGTFYRSTITGNRGIGQNVFKWMANGYWTPKNNKVNQPRPFHRADQYWSYLSNDNSYWYDNMAYFRLKNVTLSYSIPKSLLSRFYISQANIFLSGNNLCLLYSAQRNYDPEVGNPQGYPAMKTYSVGLNVTF